MAEKKKTVKKSVKRAPKKIEPVDSSFSDLPSSGVSDEKMEERVEDYLYNPETDVKIEPPKEEPSPKKKKRSGKKSPKKVKLTLGAKIVLVTAKILFIYIPLTIASIIFVALIVIKAFLSPGRVEKLATENFNKLSNATLTLDVKSFNPYRGFEIENIVISNPAGFGSEPMLDIDRLVLDYSFFSIFTGNVKFREIGIYNPKVLLVQKNGEWNAAKLMKPSEKKEEPEKEKKEKDKKPKKESEPKDSITLPIAVSVLFNFALKDLDVTVYGEEFSTVLKGFDTSMHLDIPPFKELALGPKAVKIIRKLSVQINPDEKLYVSLNSEVAKVSPPLLFTFGLNYSGEDDKSTKFESHFKAGTYGTPIQFQGTDLKPLSVNADYDLYYDPIADYLKINSFGVSFAGDRWLDLAGTVTELTTKQNIDIVMKESNINLDALYPYYLAVLKDDKMKFSGLISLKPLEVKGTGTPVDVSAKGALSLSKIKFSMPEFGITIPKFVFDYDALYKDGNVDAGAGISMPLFRYKLGRHQSGYNTLNLELAATTAENFKVINLSSFDLAFQDPKTGLNALSIDMNAGANMKEGTKAQLSINQLIFRSGALANTLPAPIAESVSGIPLKKPVYMNMDANYEGGGDEHKGKILVGFKVPDYEVYDLKISTDAGMNMTSKIAKLNSLKVWSKSYGLNLKAAGFVDTNPKPGVPFKNSNIDISLKVANKKMRTMYGPWKLKGDIGLNANMKGDLKGGRVKGNIDIDHLYVKNEDKNLLLDVEDFNLDFPYEYKFTSTFTGVSKTAADKTDIINNQYFKEKENFSIKSIKAVHPARPIQYEYMTDFRATMFFKDNNFEISKMKMTVMNGSVYMRDTFFYLADMNPENMEYNVQLDATNINIGKLDNPDKATNKSSELSFTTKLTGKNVIISESLTTEGYVKIYRVGPKFANQLMKALSTDQGESKLGVAQPVVDNTVTLDKFLFNIEKGNVYATVKLKKKAISYFTASIKDDEIKFDRIPIGEFLRKVQEGE